jgi:stage III sporulation protein AG
VEESKKTKTSFWRRPWVLILGALCGVALVLVGNRDLITKEGEKVSANETESDALLVYADELERKIEALCSHVNGVDEVRAVVSLSGDFTYIYASDRESAEREGTIERQEQYVTVGSGSNAQPLLLTRLPPTIEGIGVVCRGGADASVRQEITALLHAAFSVGSNKIYVAEAKP